MYSEVSESRDIARGIRTRLRSRGLSFVDKRRGVNFVYNLAGEYTRENIVPMPADVRHTRGKIPDPSLSDLAFRCATLYCRRTMGGISPCRDIKRIQGLGILSLSLSLSFSRVIETTSGVLYTPCAPSQSTVVL